MTTLKLSEAKAHLGSYARKAANGESFVITDRNRPVAMLTPYPNEQLGIKPSIGLMEGMASIPEDFDAPLKDFENAFYAG